MSNATIAGGDYVLGKVATISGENGSYAFRFFQTDGHVDLLSGCREFDVKVEYERTPWFSWLPFIRTVHPTKEKTEEAALFLRTANQEDREIYFGYMGHGLVPTSTQCLFKSRGMALDQEKGEKFVLSYHDPI
ncbi:MAG TPA: hypothetical protein VM532_15660 [Burkholderiales bacterium]|nr:hypothetical protein [Burkholderiales bacterium]